MFLSNRLEFVVLSCLMCAGFRSATIFNTFMCSIGFGPGESVTTTGSCRVTSPGNNGELDYARADSSIFYSINDNFNLVFRQQASGFPTSSFRGITSVDNEFNIVLSTPGPARMGIIRGYAARDASVGVVQTTVDFPGLPDSLRSGYGPGFDAGGGTIYVPLGAPFPLQTSATFSSSSAASVGLSGTYRFYELHGVTPVSIAEIAPPEPESMGLAGAGMVLLALCSRRFPRN